MGTWTFPVREGETLAPRPGLEAPASAPICHRPAAEPGAAMSRFEVREISPDDAVGLRELIRLPREVSRNDPFFSPLSESKVLAELRNPLPGVRQRILAVFEKGRLTARLAARLTPPAEGSGPAPIGILGFFEAFDRPEAVAALLGMATGWLRDQEAARVVGPIDGDTWHRYRWNVGPWDRPPFLMEPWNPPYYARLFEKSGFRPTEEYSSRRIEDVGASAEAIREKHVLAERAGYRFRGTDRGPLTVELRRIHEASLACFRGNPFYSDIPADRFLALYDGAERLIEPELLQIAEAPDGSLAGFLFSLPDRERAVRFLARHPGPIGKLGFAALRHSVGAVNYKTLAVVPDHRRSGLGGALLYLAYRAALGRGWRSANHCLIREGNVSERYGRDQGAIFRRYVLFEQGG